MFILRNKYKILVILLIMFIIGVIGHLFIYLSTQKTAKVQNAIFDGKVIYFDSKEYIIEPNISSIKLEKRIAFTNTNVYIYAIENQDINEWIALNAGGTIIFRRKNLGMLNLNAFRPTKIEIEDNVKRNNLGIINEQTLIDTFTKNVENNVSANTHTFDNQSITINLYSDKYKGLIYKMVYLKDKEGVGYVTFGNQAEVHKVDKMIDQFIKK